MRLSHEVTVGDRHGREPAEQRSTVVFSPKGRQAATRNDFPTVPSGLSV